MYSNRFLVAFTFGLGLGLTACAGEQGDDIDLDADSPEMHVMGGGDTLPPGSGTGPNGSNPAPHCLKAMVQSMSYFAAGWEPGPGGPGTAVGNQTLMGYLNGNPVYGTTYPYNSNLWWVRCDDTLQSPTDDVYPYPRLLDEADTLKAMTWAGASKDHGIEFNGATYWGSTSWFARDWGGDDWSNLMDPANRDILGGVLAAKWNYNQGVMIRLEIPAFDGQGSDLTVGGGYPEYFDLFEMMVVFDPEAPAVQPPSSTITYASPGLHVFLGSGVAEHCAYTDQYFRKRLCHNGVSCPYQQIALPQSSIPSLCKKADGTAATGVHDASTCYDGLRAVKVFVNSWDIANLGVCLG